MRWLAAGCLVLAASCINIKPYGTPVDSGATGDGAVPPIGIVGEVHAVMDPDRGITVTGPGYVVHFPGTGTGFPDDIIVASIHVLKTSSSCHDASGTGQQILPTLRSDVGGTAPSNLTLSSAGPVVARVVIAWTPDLGTCGSATATSAWSFFPDGRISRFDAVAANAANPSTCAACGGGMDTQFTVRVETLFDHTTIRSLEAPDNTPVLPTPAGNDHPGDMICMDNPAYHLIAFDGRGPAPLLYEIGGDLGVVYNISYPLAMLADTYTGHSGLIVTAPSSSCQPDLDRFKNLQYYVDLFASDGLNGTANYDGIAGGFTLTPGEFGFPVTGSSITFEPKPTDPSYVPAPPGYAIGIKFPLVPPSYVVTNKAGDVLGADKAKFQQLGTDGRVILWLRDGINFGDAITVTAQ